MYVTWSRTHKLDIWGYHAPEAIVGSGAFLARVETVMTATFWEGASL